jgi:hypothetical protein
VVAGRLSACVPVRSDNSWPSTSLHGDPRRRAGARGIPARVGRGGLVVRRRRSPAGARGRPRLLRPGLERTSRAGRRTRPRPLGGSARRGPPAPLRDRPGFRRRERGRAAGHERVGVRRKPRRHRGRARLGGSEHGGVVPLGRRPARPRRTHRPDPLPADLVARGARALAGRAARGRGRGVLERPGAAERQRDDRRTPRWDDDRALAGPADRRSRRVDRRRVALVRALRRDRDGVRADLARWHRRAAVARRRVHRRRGDQAEVCDRRRRIRRVDHAPGARASTRARAVRSRHRGVEPVYVVQRRRDRRHRVPGRAHDQVDRGRRDRDRGPADDAARCRGSAAAADARARWAHLELGGILLGLGAERGPARERRLRLPACRTRGGASAAATRSRRR